MNNTDNLRAEIRGDLIKRLFAVAISVGAAATLAKMEWVSIGRLPNLGEWQQLSILVVALTATVLSWDGYLISISKRPLVGFLGFWRFTIDVGLVFIYLLLLMTSHHKTWWIPIHALTYTLYAIWDYLSVWQYTDQYIPNNTPKKRYLVYYKGLTGTKESSGPIITIFWGLYFYALLIISGNYLHNSIFISTAFAMAGLIFYRMDKYYRYNPIIRIIIMSILIILYYCYFRFGPNFGDQKLWNLVTSYI